MSRTQYLNTARVFARHADQRTTVVRHDGVGVDAARGNNREYPTMLRPAFGPGPEPQVLLLTFRFHPPRNPGSICWPTSGRTMRRSSESTTTALSFMGRDSTLRQ